MTRVLLKCRKYFCVGVKNIIGLINPLRSADDYFDFLGISVSYCRAIIHKTASKEIEHLHLHRESHPTNNLNAKVGA